MALKNSTTETPDTSLKTSQSDPAVQTGTGMPPSDWNPNGKPLDGSPVLTAVPQRRLHPGQTGYKPKTVAEHNAWVKGLAESDKGGQLG